MIIRIIYIAGFLSLFNESFCLIPGADSASAKKNYNYIYEDNLIEKEEIRGIWNVSPIKPVKDILVTGINDTWALLKSPLDWDSTSFFLFPSIALATYFLLILDEPITYNMLADKKYANSDIIRAAEIYGRSITSEVSAAGFTLIGMALNDKKIISMGLEIFESYFLANNIQSVIKRAFGRARPGDDKGIYYFDPF